MLVDGNFDEVVVAGLAFAERVGAPHEHAAAVAQLAIERFDNPRAGLAYDMRGGRQHL